jgi:hypothetical protein
MERKYVKQTQKEYTMQFKLQIAKEIEEGIFTASQTHRNYGIQYRHAFVRIKNNLGSLTIFAFLSLVGHQQRQFFMSKRAISHCRCPHHSHQVKRFYLSLVRHQQR